VSPQAESEEIVVLERYRLTRRLGEGGMGTVYEGEHIHLGTKHAVKALRPYGTLTEEQQRQLESRFLREAKICASIRHANLVPVTDFGTSEGVPYLVMDFIDGEDLQQLISKQGGLGEKMSLEVLRDVASAVGALHDKDILHRDLKPPNVMIERKTGRVILTDLGIAKDLTGGGTQQTQGILGTPSYMAPEQMIDTSKTGFESDVYALGACLYSMLAGKDPFEGDNPLVVLQQARENLFAYGSLAGVAKSRDRLSLSPQTDALLDAMTKYERKERLGRTKDVVGRVDSILAGVDSSAWAGTQHLASEQAAGLRQGDEMTLFDMEMLETDAAQGPAGGPPRPESPAPSAAAGGPQAGAPRAPSPSAPAGVDVAPPKPASTRQALAALSGDEGGVRAGGSQRSFAAVWALLALLAAGGGGAFYYFKVFLPGQKPPADERTADGPAEETAAPAKPEKPPAERPATEVAGATTQAEGPSVGVKGPAVAEVEPPAPAFDESKAPRSIKVALGGARPLELVLVRSGRFRLGSSDPDAKDEGPVREIELTRPFYIGRHEVTAGQFAAFLAAEPGRLPAQEKLGEMGLELVGDAVRPFEGLEDQPVASVSHVQARSFCRWASKLSGLKIGLPGEVEWEYAARGPESPKYPWGEEWDEALCSAGRRDSGPVAVGSFPDGASWCGAEDMAGSVFEWCADKWDERRYRKLPRRAPPVLGAGSSSGMRVIRGGSFVSNDYICRASFRNAITGSASHREVGLRVKAKATQEVARYATEGPDEGAGGPSE
jgi:formylglycine-generating enzyme required for sulfatase activity